MYPLIISKMPKYTLSHFVNFSKSCTINKISKIMFVSFGLQVMVQKQNRHMSMSVYLAVLAVDDTIVLASGRKLNVSKYLITNPKLGFVCTRWLYFNFSSWIGSIEISLGTFLSSERVHHPFLHLFPMTKTLLQSLWSQFLTTKQN